jgi:MYXO-CTERM domain-containing protein
MENTPQLSSPGFLVLRAGTQTTSSASSATSVSSSSSVAGSSFATSSAASDLPPAQTSQSADGLTTGAKSGIGVGVALGGLVLIGVVAAFVLRRRRETVGGSVKELDSHTAEKTMYPAQPGFAHPQQNGPYEMPSQHAPAELGNS